MCLRGDFFGLGWRKDKEKEYAPNLRSDNLISIVSSSSVVILGGREEGGGPKTIPEMFPVPVAPPLPISRPFLRVRFPPIRLSHARARFGIFISSSLDPKRLISGGCPEAAEG